MGKEVLQVGYFFFFRFMDWVENLISGLQESLPLYFLSLLVMLINLGRIRLHNNI